MDSFVGTFLGGVGVAGVAGLGWLSFFHPAIFLKIAIAIFALSTLAYMLLVVYSVGFIHGAGPLTATPISFEAASAILLGVDFCLVVLYGISLASPHKTSQKTSNDD